MVVDQVNFLITIFQNRDVAEVILCDYLEHFIYVSVYYWKWYFIYITAFLTGSVLVFILTLIYVNIVYPIKEITDTILMANKREGTTVKVDRVARQASFWGNKKRNLRYRKKKSKA